MSEDTLVVVGAGLAGLRACETAVRGGHRGPVVLIGDEQHLPYDRPPLSKAVLDASPEPATALATASSLRELGIDVRIGTTATGLDPVERVLATDRGDVSYGELIIATGVRARNVPESETFAGILPLRTLDDARRVRTVLASRDRLVVVGAGFIGSEVASAARKRGVEVTIVEGASAPLVRSLGAEVGRLCADLHHRNGTDLRLGTTITAMRSRAGVEPDGSGRLPVASVELSDGTVIDTGAVVLGIGASPATGWLKGSGVRVDERDGGVVCGPGLSVLGEDDRPIDHLWAAGDVAHWPNPLFGHRLMRLEHWTSAAEQGAAAARNALADPIDRTAYSTVPYFWSDWYDTRIQFAGIPYADDIVVQHRGDRRGGTVVLYRGGDRIVGVLTIGRPDLIMKYRRFVAAGAPFSDAVDFEVAGRASA